MYHATMMQAGEKPYVPKAWRKGFFTLIELLVVVVIMMVLISILLPALKGAMEKGRIITCKSNQKQISLGMFVYASSWNEWGPCNDSMPSLNTGNRLPYDAYASILWKAGAQNAPYLVCPGTDKGWMNNSNPGNVPGVASSNYFTSSYITAFGTGIRILGFADSGWFGWYPANTSTTLGSSFYFKQCPALKLCGQKVYYTSNNGTTYGPQTIQVPSKQPILGEHGGPTGMESVYMYTSNMGSSNNYSMPNNHASGSTVTYADGHQEWGTRLSYSPYYAVWYYGTKMYLGIRN